MNKIIIAIGAIAAFAFAPATASAESVNAATTSAQTVTVTGGSGKSIESIQNDVSLTLSANVGLVATDNTALTEVGVHTHHLQSSSAFEGNTSGGSLTKTTATAGTDVASGDADSALSAS